MESSRRAEDERATPLEAEEQAAGADAPEAAEWLPAGFTPAAPATEMPAAENPPPPPVAAPTPEPPRAGEGREPAAPEPAAAPTADPELAARQGRLERRVEDVLRLQEQNGRQQSALTAATESLHGRVEELERRLAEISRRADRDEALAEVATYVEAREPAPPPADGSPVDLNAADFDQLRALGLSITQAARLIARRDAVDGFSSEEEVVALPGFPKGVLEDLLSRTRL